AAFIGLVTFGIVVSVLWRSAESSRHKAAILLGRSRIHQDDPINASRILWREFLKRDVPRTRLALVELYSRYPFLWGNADVGRQVDVAYSPGGKWLAAVGKDGRLIVYDAKSGTVSHVVDEDRVHARCLEFSSASPSVVYVGGTDGNVRVLPFSEDDGAIGEEPVETLGVSGGRVSCLAVSDDGQRLAAGCVVKMDAPGGETPASSLVRLWSTASYEERSSWTIECEGVADLAFSKDATKLAAGTIAGCVDLSGRMNGRTRIWSTEDGRLLHESDLTAGVHHRAVLFSEDGARLYCGAEHVLQWDLEKNDTALLEGAAVCGVRGIAAPDQSVDRYLAFASGDGRIRFLDTQTDALVPIQGYHDGAVSDDADACFSRDGKSVVSVGNDGVRVWR
ncbi:MAG: hypothetical protein GY851_28765, partial [bacterium]|nr:hypothetical protein [bacterium]